MRRNVLGLSVLSCIAITTMITGQASAQIFFEFDNDSPFDLGQGIDATQLGTAEDGSPAPTAVNVKTVDLFAPEFVSDGAGGFTQTTNVLLASAGAVVTTQTNSNSLGIDNPSISDDDFFAGAGIENRDFNDGEGWVVEFDVDVSFTELNLASLDDGTLTVTIEGIGTFTIVDEMIEGDAFADPFGLDFIPAGTNITFAYTTPVADANFRINSFTVTTEERPEALLGDVNLSGMVDFDDIGPFIQLLASGMFQAEADIDENEMVDFDDIAPFINILAGP